VFLALKVKTLYEICGLKTIVLHIYNMHNYI